MIVAGFAGLGLAARARRKSKAVLAYLIELGKSEAPSAQGRRRFF